MSADPNQPITQLDRLKKGEPLSARKLNASVDSINRLNGGVRPPQQRRKEKSASGVSLDRLSYVSMAGDFMNCHAFNADGTIDTSALVPVAKPPLLRRSVTSRGTVTFTYTSDTERTGTKAGVNELQVIVPSFIAGDNIFAAFEPFGGTGVANTSYLDVNINGRAWAKKAGT